MFTARSTDFDNGAQVPQRFTCDGDDAAPQILVDEAPEGTRSFAITMIDPDAPDGDFAHWLVYDIPPAGEELAVGRGKTLKNSFGRIGYGGPCPPRGDGTHRYIFTVYAVDVPALSLRAGERRELDNALQSHTLATAQFTGRYSRAK
jgi:hypothetical protein